VRSSTRSRTTLGTIARRKADRGMRVRLEEPLCIAVVMVVAGPEVGHAA
jgi:hypothetical protein